MPNLSEFDVVICAPVGLRTAYTHSDAITPNPHNIAEAGFPAALMAASIQKRSFRVCLIGHGLHYKGTPQRFDVNENFSIIVLPWPRPGLVYFLKCLLRGNQTRLAQALKHSRKIICHWTAEHALCAHANRAAIRNTINIIHDAPLSILSHEKTPTQLLRTISAYILSRRKSLKVFVSGYLRQHYKDTFHRPETSRIVIPNITSQIPNIHKDTKPHPQYVICILSQWGKLKNGKALIAAAAILANTANTPKIKLIGPDFSPNGPAYKWASLECPDAIKQLEFCGPLYSKPLSDVVAGAALLVHPALEESFGMTVAEAMSAGIPSLIHKYNLGSRCVLGPFADMLSIDMTQPRIIAQTIIDFTTSTPPVSQDELQKRYQDHFAETKVTALLTTLLTSKTDR